MENFGYAEDTDGGLVGPVHRDPSSVRILTPDEMNDLHFLASDGPRYVSIERDALVSLLGMCELNN
jgi:hypothetical protein